MAVPKGKTSKARRDKRRSSHWKLETPGIVACPNCGAYHLPHRVCRACGQYKGREVIKIGDEKKK
jgi:large subunit ribosomal protein L32